MLRIVFGIVMFAHGAIHLLWLAPKPADPKYPFRWRSPLLPKLPEATLKAVTIPLIALQVLAYSVAALGVVGVPALTGVWGAAAVLGSTLSIVLIAILWDRDFIFGPIVDVAIIAVVLMGWIR
jgi:hypothetical protein